MAPEGRPKASPLGVLGLAGAEEDSGLGVGDEAGADFGGGAAVVGLGGEVFEAVGDGDVGDAVGAGEFLAGLVVAGDLRVAEQGPDLFEHLVSPGDGVGFGDQPPPATATASNTAQDTKTRTPTTHPKQPAARTFTWPPPKTTSWPLTPALLD